MDPGHIAELGWQAGTWVLKQQRDTKEFLPFGTSSNKDRSHMLIASSNKCMLSFFSRVWLCATLWIIAYQSPLSMDFSRKNTGVCCHFLLQGIFPTQGSNPCSLCLLHWQAGFFTTSAAITSSMLFRTVSNLVNENRKKQKRLVKVH